MHSAFAASPAFGVRIQIPPLSAVRVPASDRDGEARLVERARERWPSAWVEVYDAHYDRLYRYCLGRTGNRAAAAKLASQVFLHAVKQIDRYACGSGQPLFSWLYRIAQKHVNDHIEREAGEGGPAAAEGLDALRTLPPEQQEAVALHFYAGCSSEEVASAMERSPLYVRHLIGRALHQLLASGVSETEAMLESPATAVPLTNEVPP